MLDRLYILCSLLLLSLSACTLSATQEEHLNKQLGSYISAVNEGRMVESVALSHPAVVKHYRAMGDSSFVEHFQSGLAGSQDFIEQPNFSAMKEKGKLIQRRYEVRYYTEEAEIDPRYGLFAVSEDGGDNWFFVPATDYFDRNIKGLHRLFDE
jgi:hypothetical protein